jgi:predicted amidohydrolase YtcJ
VLIRAGAIYSLAKDLAVYRAIALQGERVAAVSTDPHGLDALASAGTRVVDDPTLTVLPAFYDTHNHIGEASRNLTLVPLERATTLGELLELIRQSAAQAAPGEWIQTSNGWHENNLAERRLPTIHELDAAAPNNPIFARRGGHLVVANSRALALAGITAGTPNPPGGVIGHFADGTLNGTLEGGAVYAAARVIPPFPLERQAAGVAQASRMFAAAGIGVVREPMALRDDLLMYQAAWERGLLATRLRLMLLITPSGTVAERIAQVAGYGVRSGFGDDWLRIWGLKMVMDGGAEGGALDAPDASDPTFSGHLNWDPDEMVTVADAAVKRGWKIGTHAVGDRAVRTLLDVYERVVAANPGLPPGTLVIEHGFLADATQRARAIRLGVSVTVQPALLYALGDQLVRLWGPERTREVMPVKAWLDEGAQLSGGTDYPIGPYAPLAGIWGFATRGTAKAGVQGPQYAIDRETAIRLYTVRGAILDGESDRRGILQPGYLADLVAFRADPLTCPLDDLLTLQPAFTVVGGRITHDPEGLLGTK